MEDLIHHYDVVVVGAGNAACSAAMAAMDQNPRARVAILEKAPKRNRGGNSALTGHMRFVYNSIDDLRPLVKNLPEDDLRKLYDRMPPRTEAVIWDDFMHVTDNQSDQELLQVHVTESLNTVRWMADKGHVWVAAGAAADNIVAMNGGGYGMQQCWFGILERLSGVTFHHETSALELIRDKKGRVVGVQALTPTGISTFNAKAVVLACGSFEANPQMRGAYLGRGWDTVRHRGVPYNTGDGLLMALDIGAMPYGSWTTCHASPQDINLPNCVTPGALLVSNETSRYMYPYSIMVNTNGERFVDEASDKRGNTYAKTGGAILAQPGGIAYQIMDSQIRSHMNYHPAYDKATTAKADSLEELAEALDIPVANFVKTVREFNAAIQPGTFKADKLHLDGKHTAGITPPKSNYSLSVEKPPFEAWPVRCGMTFCYGGLKTDAKTGQVQHVAGWPIEGLYAAGEMVGGLFVGNYPSGSGIMSGSTFGRVAGKHAAIAASKS